MKTIKETLDGLPDADRDRLLVAFNNGLSHVVRLKDGTFIGVNVDHVGGLTVEASTDNGWAIGVTNGNGSLVKA